MKGQMKSWSVLILILLTVLYSQPLFAQCAMCKAAVESGGSDINISSLNAGILYLASFAYILISVIGFILYRNSKYYAPTKEKVLNYFRKLKE